MTDRVDKIIEEWSGRRPDLDTSALAVVSRVLRASHHLEATLDRVAAAYGLSHQGDLDALMALYRADPEQGLRPTELAEALLSTTGGMTARLHRLQQAGLIDRIPNPRDGRPLPVGRAGRQTSCSSTWSMASSSLTFRANDSSETSTFLALLYMVFSPAESPLDFSRRRRFRTTSATW